MSSPVQFLLVDAACEAARALGEQLCQRGFTLAQQELGQVAGDGAWKQPDVAVIALGGQADRCVAEQTARLLERLVAENVATVVWGASDNIRWAGGPLVQWLDPATSADEVIGRLSTLAHYLPLVRRFEQELAHLHDLGNQLNRYFSEIDQEMRLAGRLQRDFLPRSLPELPGLRFSVLYRPASWVSGDMYDLLRIDERHLGIFIADAIGHGVAAGLLTMFLRQALVTRQLDRSSDALVRPAAVMTDLNNCLVRQKLPNCQFVTAAYTLYDTERRELCLSRAGHPYPLRVRPGGEIEPIVAAGGLLGLADLPAEFEEVRLTLGRGDKVLFYTDGLEDDFFAGPPNRAEPGEFSAALREWVTLGARELVEALQTHLDHKEGSLNPSDDVTLLVLEVVS